MPKLLINYSLINDSKKRRDIHEKLVSFKPVKNSKNIINNFSRMRSIGITKNKLLLGKYDQKLKELLEILDEYYDPRLAQYSERANKATDDILIQQINDFEKKLKHNYQKIFKSIIKDLALLARAQTYLKNIYHQRHPSSKEFSMNRGMDVAFNIYRDEIPTPEPINLNELDLENEITLVFELEKLRKSSAEN